MFIPEMADDIGVFMQMVWPSLGMEPHDPQIRFAEFLTSDQQYIMGMAPRGFGKSNILSTLVNYFGYRDPDVKIMVLSATEKRAKDIVRQAKAMVKNCQLLVHMAPLKDDLDGELRFNFGNRVVKAAKDPSVAAYGMNAGMTGAHADIVLVDDLEIPENSVTPEGREKIRERVRELSNICNVGGKIIIIGTPQTLESVYFALIDEGIYELCRIPAETPEPTNEKSMLGLPGWLLDKMETGELSPGDPVYPERMGREWLLEQQAKQGRSRYCLQMLLDPTSSDEGKYPLKLRDFIVTDLGVHEAPARVVWGTTDPARDIKSPGIGADHFYRPIFMSLNEWLPYEHKVMTIDPAGFGGDEVGYCVGGAVGGKAFILRAGGLEGGYSDGTLKKLLGLAQECEVRRIVVEKNWADGLYGKQLQGLAAMLGTKVAVEPMTVTGQKESRIIDLVEPVLNSHRLVVDTSVARNWELMYQLSHMSRERGCLRKDDRADAFSLCIACLQGYLFRDAEKSQEDFEKAQFQADIAEFMALTGSKPKPKPKRWIRI